MTLIMEVLVVDLPSSGLQSYAHRMESKSYATQWDLPLMFRIAQLVLFFQATERLFAYYMKTLFLLSA